MPIRAIRVSGGQEKHVQAALVVDSFVVSLVKVKLNQHPSKRRLWLAVSGLPLCMPDVSQPVSERRRVDVSM